MYDKNGLRIRAGNYVRFGTGRFGWSGGTAVGMIGEIDDESAMILVKRNGKVLGIEMKHSMLARIEEYDVTKKDQKDLISARGLFYRLKNDARFLK